MQRGLVLAFLLSVAAAADDLPDPPDGSGSRYPWPFAPTDGPIRLLSSYQNPLRVELASAYFHGGVDIYAKPGSKIMAIARGQVEVYSDGGMENVVLTEEGGDVWEYRHIAMGTVPDSVRRAEESLEWVEVGVVLGESVRWGSTGYDHVHLNRRRADGAIEDPLDYLVRLEDTIAPVIEEILVLPDGGDVPLVAGEDGVIEVSGPIDLAVAASDEIGTDGVGRDVGGSDGEGTDREEMAPRFHHVPAAFLWTIGDRPPRRFAPWEGSLPETPRSPVPRYPREHLRACYLLSGPSRTRNPTFTPVGQRFVSLITNTDDRGRPDPAGCLDVGELLEGEGEVVVSVAAVDHAGNQATASIRLRVRRP